MHNLETKIMINGFKLPQMLEFPGAHGFSITEYQIYEAQKPTSLSDPPPHWSTASLPQDAIDRAKEAKWPPQFFDPPQAGGSDGSFVRFFTSRLELIVFMVQRNTFYDTSYAVKTFMGFIREEVVEYRMLMERLLDPQTSKQAILQEGAKALKKILDSEMDLLSSYKKWNSTLIGRYLPAVQWRLTQEFGCNVWIDAKGELVADLPDSWNHTSDETETF